LPVQTTESRAKVEWQDDVLKGFEECATALRAVPGTATVESTLRRGAVNNVTSTE
jgi:hypothetical protein